VKIAYDGVNLVVAIAGTIYTDVKLMLSTVQYTESNQTNTKYFTVNIPEGARQESWRKGGKASQEAMPLPPMNKTSVLGGNLYE
jgi:flavin reductase (DIM6/NTAB) family NADH-FMN oxidoreductase RutF